MVTATLSNGKTFPLQLGKTILESAQAAGLALAHSCRTGRCGICKAQVKGGRTSRVQSETSLTPADAAEDYVLTCSRTAAEDIRLDIEDLGDFADQQVRTLPSRIDSLSRVGRDLALVTLRTPPGRPIGFLPGQYVDVIQGGIRRSYSIANAPRPDGRIELHIRRVDGGELSGYWFERAKAGDLLHIEGPLGTFALRRGRHDRILLLATGTGIAPVKAMLEGEGGAEPRAGGTSLSVYWGGRSAEDFYWNPAAPGVDVAYHPVVSRPDPAWTGETGYVQDAVLREGCDLSRAAVYACGSERMIAAARDALVAKGLPPRNFHSDAFVASEREIRR